MTFRDELASELVYFRGFPRSDCGARARAFATIDRHKELVRRLELKGMTAFQACMAVERAHWQSQPT